MPNFSSKPMSRSLRVYQKAAIFFVIITILLLLAVLYLSVSQANIRVVPAESVVSATIPVEVANDVNAIGQVEGLVVTESFAKAKTFALPEEGSAAVEGNATGVVTLINETGSDQPLIATTRVLSEEGILFRLDDGVTVPANGQVDAVVSADEPGLSGEIGASQFTIPGLPSATQEVIYAVSVDSMTGGVQYIRSLSQADLDQAVADLSEEILEESKEVLKANADDSLDGEAFTVTIIEQISDTEPGTETGNFNVSLSVEVTAIFYEQESIADFAQTELHKQLQVGYELVRTNADGMTSTVQSVDSERGVATLEVYLDGIATITTAADVLDLDRLTGKTAEEVMDLLEANEAIDDVAVNFAPFWLKRVPTLKDHIKIEVVR